MKSSLGFTLSVISAAAGLHAQHVLADSDNVQFDTSLLKDRGLSASVGQYFSSAARYTPGIHSVDVQVNGRDIGQLSPRFGSDGQLCVTESFLQSSGLIVPAGVARLAREEEASGQASSSGSAGSVCYDYRKDYPTAEVTPLPGTEALSIVVPPEAVDNTSGNGPAQNYRTGGTAGLLNYQAFSTKTQAEGSSGTTYDQAMLEEGINVHDWLLRSRQSLTWNDGVYSSDRLYTYAQRTIVPLKKQLQAGQINTTGSLLSGVSVTGIQLTPEDALLPDSGSGVQITGIARGPQARVDVRQQGRVVYSSLVPAGPFTLTDVPVVSRNNDLDVTVTETDGSKNHFVIPASAINGNQLSSPGGMSLAVGRYRDEGSGSNSGDPWLMTVSDGWRLRPWLNAGAGFMLAQKYNAVAGSVDTLPLNNLTVSGTFKVSDDQRGGNRGSSSTLSANYSFGPSFGIGAATTYYSSGYRDLPDTLSDSATQYSGQYTANMHWNSVLLGSFSLGYSLSQGTGGSSDSRYVNASWGRSFGKVNVSVNWQTQIGNTDSCDTSNHDSSGQCTTSNTSNGDLFFVNVSIPFGEHYISAYSRTQSHDTSNGAQISGNLTDNSSYSFSADRDTGSRESDFSGSVNSNLHYTQLGLNAGTQGSTSKNYSVSLNGGVVAHGGGVTFSPWPIKDTFAIVDAGREARGAEITTSSGPVWTDYWGQAVIPSIPAYRSTRVEMNTASLPEGVDIDNGFAQLAAGHGSVSHVNFRVLNVRRVMMHVRMADGSVLKKGGGVLDAQGNYIATAVDDGLIFLGDATGSPALYVAGDTGQRLCQIKYTLPESNDKSMAYEQISGVCQ